MVSRRQFLGVVGASAVATAGCLGNGAGDGNGDGRNYEWQTQVGSGTTLNGDFLGVAGDTVVVGSADEGGPALYGYAADSGGNRFTAGSGPVTAFTTVEDGVVVAGGGEIVLYEGADGNSRWRREGVAHTLESVGETVIAANDGGCMGIDPSDGSIAWTVVGPADATTDQDEGTNYLIATNSDTVFLTRDDGRVRALDPDDGTSRWDRTLTLIETLPGSETWVAATHENLVVLRSDGPGTQYASYDAEEGWLSAYIGSDIGALDTPVQGTTTHHIYIEPDDSLSRVYRTNELSETFRWDEIVGSRFTVYGVGGAGTVAYATGAVRGRDGEAIDEIALYAIEPMNGEEEWHSTLLDASELKERGTTSASTAREHRVTPVVTEDYVVAWVPLTDDLFAVPL